ncbi:outer membrane protein [Haliscomenobacter sp.]|uniref:outer membrane protein n=1 Tax=Haliscomenobacter sp. TaxID=2717303 RepID=UPI003BA8CA8B
MRDNLHEDLFADHAWQEMHKLLDREMPQRKRRGAFWLWFLPALGLCVLLGRDTLLEGKIPVAEEKPQQSQPVIAQGKKHTVQPADKHSKTNPEEPTSAPVQQAERKTEAIAALAPARGVEKSQKTGKNRLSTGTKTRQEPQILVDRTATSGDLLPANVLKNEAIPTVAAIEGNVGVPSSNSAEQDHTALDEPSVERWSASEFLNTRKPDLNLPSVEMEKVSIKPQRARQKLEWWAEAGTQLASGVKGLSGYKAGILSGIPIGRMRILTGLNYEMTEVGIQSIQRDILTGKENISGIKVAVADRTSVSAGQNNSQSVSSIHFQVVNLSLSLYHPIGKRFGVAFGGNLHYLGGIKLGNQYIRSTLFDNVENSLQFSTTVGNSLAQPQDDNLSKNSFRSFGFSAQGAVSYRISTRWSASLGYRQSLQHFTKTSDLLLKPSWVDLGLRYRIK